MAVLLLYSVTMFAGATLLFVVQPMVGKMILPLLGGTPAVWSTCMVFFQAALLGGYAYAHASTAWLSVRRQMLLHLALLALPLAVLPLAVNPALLRGGESNPILDVLLLLSLSVGLPFLVVSATAPLIQKWFSQTGHPAARDPYFLYAASNLGSMLALLGYPTLIEPRLHLRGDGWLTQTSLWSLGYFALAVLIVLCALTLGRRRGHRWRAVERRAARAAAELGEVSALDRAGVRAVEPPDRRHHVHHDGHRRRPPALGAAARHLPPELHPGLRPLAGAPASPGGGGDRSDCPRRVLPHALRIQAADLDHGALAFPAPLRRRPRMSRRAGSHAPGGAPPDPVLSPALGGRRARRDLQRPDRARRPEPDRRVPARDGAGLPARGPPQAATRRETARLRGGCGPGARGRCDGTRAFFRPRHPPARHRLLHPVAQDPVRDRRGMDHARRGDGPQAPGVRHADRRASLPEAAPGGPGAGPRPPLRRGGIRGRPERQPDPPGPELFRSPAGLARRRSHRLHRASPRHDASRPAEPGSRASCGAARVLSPRQSPRPRDGRARAAQPGASGGRDRARGRHARRLRAARRRHDVLRNRPSGARHRHQPVLLRLCARRDQPGGHRAYRNGRRAHPHGPGAEGAARGALRPHRGGRV